MRILRSAVSLGSSTISWSQPTPVRRSAMARASAGVTSNGVSRASTITKSLPRPCILWKCRRIGRDLGSGPGQVHQRGRSHAESRERRHAIDHLLGGARRRRRVEARVGRPAQPAAARRPGDPSQCDFRRFAQGASGRRSRRARARPSPSFEGRLCGRPATADASIAADGPRARSPAPERPARTAARAAQGPPGASGRPRPRGPAGIAAAQAQGQANLRG